MPVVQVLTSSVLFAFVAVIILVFSQHLYSTPTHPFLCFSPVSFPLTHWVTVCVFDVAEL